MGNIYQVVFGQKLLDVWIAHEQKHCHEESLHCYTTFLVIFSACSQFTQQFQIKVLIHHLSWRNELLVQDPIHIKEINQHGFIVNNLVSHTFMDLGEFSSFHWFDNDLIYGQ